MSRAKRLLRGVKAAVETGADYIPDVVEGPLRRALDLPELSVPKRKAAAKRKPSTAKVEKPKTEKPLAVRSRRAPQIAALKDIRPSTDDVYQAMEANTTAGRVTGDKMMPIDKLTGGVTEAADDTRRVDQLVAEMSSPSGYVSRLIVDDAGNVIEGQHRLEALRRLGASEVPVTQYADLERVIPFTDVRDAAAAQGIHPDQANQIAKQLAEIYADEGGDMVEVMSYEPPKGFEGAWKAALSALPDTSVAGTQSLAAKVEKPLAAKKRTKYQPVEPVAEPHPELEDVTFPEGSGRGGTFAVENKVPIVGRRPFIAQSPGGYSRLAGGLPANQVTVETAPFLEMPARQFIDPHELVKDFRSIIPFIGDKLRGGEDILSVAGRPQEGAARAFSGPDFARQQIAAGGNEVWASGPSVISAIDRMAKDAQDRFGGRVAGVYTAMGPEGADQTTTMMDLIGRQIAAGDISQSDKQAFDNFIRNASRKDDEPIPNFVGFANDPMAAIEQLNDINNITMGQRRTLTQAMNAKPWLEAGFPDIGANRAAATIPDLLYAPEGTSGYMISALEPGKGALPDEAVSMRHPNYAKKLGGTYIGGFEVGVPRELVWSQLYNRPEMKRYEPFRQLSYLFGRAPKEIRADLGFDPRIQPINEEWADQIAEYIDAVKKYGAEPYATGGLAARKGRPSFAAKAR